MQTLKLAVRASLNNEWRRRISLCSVFNQVEIQTKPVEDISIPPPSNVEKTLSPKIEQLIAAISNLTLLEVSELSGGLKKRLNLPDAPVMPVGFAAPAPAEDDEPPAPVKSLYTVKLMKFDEKQKVALIKEVKAQIEGMNLVQSKKFVESAPTVLKAEISKDEAEKLKEIFTKVGAEIVID
ncbi:hypothetical protein FQA39_LY03672 [Lamprigera yunnana]|nr:hypothetical protein FQA39_LY03672 [Lamprigera yunnana]